MKRVPFPGGHSTLFLVGMSGAKCQNGKCGSKELIFCEVRSKELKIFNIWKVYELIFEPNLGCRAESSSNFWHISLIGVKIKWESKELNHAATGDLKNGGRGVKRGSWLLDILMPPFQVSAPFPGAITSIKLYIQKQKNVTYSIAQEWYDILSLQIPYGCCMS